MTASKNPGPVPEVAIEYLTRKGLKVGFNNQDVWNDEYLRSFTVSGITREDILRDIQRQLNKALTLGETYQSFAENIEQNAVEAGWWGVKPGDETNKKILSPTRLRTIYDTNLRTARSASQWNRVERNKKTFPMLQYRIGPSERHRPAHVRWDGMVFPVGHSFWDTHMPPNGFGCFLPDTIVGGEIVGGSKALYSGKALKIYTQGSRMLTVTPNHPIATPTGFVEAGQLRTGDDCIGHTGKVETIIRSGGLVTHKQSPTLIKKVFEAMASHGRTTAQVTNLDFHGEAQNFVGEVSVVGSYWELAEKLETARFQMLIKSVTAFVRSRIAETGHRLFDTFVPSLLASFRSLPGLLALPYGVCPSPFGPQFKTGFTATAYGDILARQQTVDSPPTHPNFLGELQDRYAGQIAIDKIVRLREFDYTGHVYDLQSVNGSVISNGIVASNCKCWVKAITKRQSDDLGGTSKLSAEDKRFTIQRSRQTGRIKRVPNGVDPGFANNPGKLTIKQQVEGI